MLVAQAKPLHSFFHSSKWQVKQLATAALANRCQFANELKKGLNWEATQSPTLPYLPAFGTNRALLTKSHYCESIFKIEAQVKNHQYTQNHSKCHAIQFI